MSSALLDRPVQLRHDDGNGDDFDEEASVQNDSEVDQSADSDSDATGSESIDEVFQAPAGLSKVVDSLQDDDSSSEPEEDSALKDISFGVLAKAQETFDPRQRKRKYEEATQDAIADTGKNEEDNFDTRKRSKEARIDAPKRSSKHAPVIESARKPVSRKRTIFEPPAAQKFRDPRFDPTVMSANRDRNTAEKVNKNYAFLTQYQAAEILDLKTQIKKAKDPNVVADLKRKVMSLESKVRNAEMRQKEEAIKRRHNQQEKEALRTGQKAKPYYLKEADVRKLAKEERLQSLGKRARDKAEKRRQKREKGKDARDMPRFRREG
ncbi:rRNA biogenesis protein rrp36 [Knufia peltigerae]|uniref:rRNA biogenesis protein RRP36 n=1 Tax=Knufia peltigerae TaxID=1002370 RepID=A0AA39CUJ3_9EURO|nr:rRNA biogenesis protein rrp36 [Knufia peltigerae]